MITTIFKKINKKNTQQQPRKEHGDEKLKEN